MTGIVIGIVLLVALVGGALIATPYIMPPTECFAVTVPPSAKQDPRIRALYRSHTLIIGALTLAGTVAMAVVFPGSNDTAATITMTATTIVPILVSFAYMLYARTQVRAIKQAEGWTASESHATAFVSDDSIPQPIPLAWELLHVVVVASLAAFALLAYDRLPDQIPMHAGLDGTVNSYAEKSLGSVMFPAMVAAFMGATMAFAHWAILRSKRPIDPAAPATSALAYGLFARIESLVLLVGGLVLNIVMGVSFFLSTMGTITLGTAGVLITIATLLFTGAEIWVSVVLGQSGSRMAAELRTTDEVSRDDDAFWKAGGFYFNPNDPSIFVPKRFGVGWTINCASPAAWAVFVGIILLAIAFSFVTLKVAG